jgi:hypothetical protein
MIEFAVCVTVTRDNFCSIPVYDDSVGWETNYATQDDARALTALARAVLSSLPHNPSAARALGMTNVLRLQSIAQGNPPDATRWTPRRQTQRRALARRT